MLRSTFRLGRIRGIEIGMHWSLLVIGGFLTLVLAQDILPDIEPDAGGSYWAAAMLAAALFFGSILAHELAHSVVAQRRGQRVDGITLWLLGGVARLRDEARDAKSEFLVAIAGPATSIALGALFIAAGFGLDATMADGSLLPVVAFYLGFVNLVLAVFNLIPGAPLDGGRILSSIVWGIGKNRRGAQIVAARAGFVVGGLLIAVGLFGALFVRGFADIWTILVGWFIIDASRSEELNARISRALDDHPIWELMGPTPPSVPEWTTVRDLHTLFPVLPSTLVLTGLHGETTAILQTGALRNIPPEYSATARVRDVAIPIGNVPAVSPDTPARAALERGVPVVVVADGRIVGVVGLDEVRRAASASRR